MNTFLLSNCYETETPMFIETPMTSLFLDLKQASSRENSPIIIYLTVIHILAWVKSTFGASEV